MKNDYLVGNTKISIPPTLLFSVVAKINDVRRAVTMDAKQAGDLVYILGTTYPELGGSEYAAQLGAIGNNVPEVREQDALPRYRALEKAITEGLVASCHDCSDGGLGVALAETCFAGGLGMDLDLRKVARVNVERDDVLLFSESQSRFVVTVAPDKAAAFEKTMAGTACTKAGFVTTVEKLCLTGLSGQRVMDVDIRELTKSWQEPLAF
jgi:phosphoribosylformylglycinamidine (FGAM) synthase-like enzyme